MCTGEVEWQSHVPRAVAQYLEQEDINFCMYQLRGDRSGKLGPVDQDRITYERTKLQAAVTDDALLLDWGLFEGSLGPELGRGQQGIVYQVSMDSARGHCHGDHQLRAAL